MSDRANINDENHPSILVMSDRAVIVTVKTFN